MRDDRTNETPRVQSVHRAISVLQVFALCGASGVTEIAAELAVHKSPVFRLLATLGSRVSSSTASAVGTSSATASCSWPPGRRRWTISLLSRPVCRQLAETGRETVNVVVHDGVR